MSNNIDGRCSLHALGGPLGFMGVTDPFMIWAKTSFTEVGQLDFNAPAAEEAFQILCAPHWRARLT